MSIKAVMITGALGGIGSALVNLFSEHDYHVIATDLQKPTQPLKSVHFIQADLNQLVEDDTKANEFFTEVIDALSGLSLCGLINNAAIQIVKPMQDLTRADWKQTLNINTIAPFLLSQALLPHLEKAEGAIVNIGSVHATLTKPHFVAYATSKAALTGLTRCLGVELGKRVRINAIAPAAIATPMLSAGFMEYPERLTLLADAHPIGRIGDPKEVAELALFLVSQQAKFINGASFQIDGGIANRLHDPV